jgi:hypothetical protein
MENTKITSIAMGSIYVDDFNKAYEFYNGLLDLNGQPGENSCFFPLSKEQAIYLEGKYNPVVKDSKIVRSAVTFRVESAISMFEKLRNSGVELIQAEPMKMAENIFWFQCYDPSGNIVEFLGGE